MISLPSQSYEVAIPEISDYELRRELLRANKFNGIRQLDLLKAQFIYIPITTETILLAAKLWADVRQRGQATADP